MHSVVLPRIETAKAWRDAARGLASAGTPPEEVTWRYGEAEPGLFEGPPAPPPSATLTVPRSFIALADTVVWHSDPERFARLYALLWRLRERTGLMADSADRELSRLREMEKAVRRDMHKMRAFLRFREVTPEGAERRAFAAWFEPAHHIVEPNARFFMDRFGDMDWLIATPDLSARFEGGQLALGPGQARPDLPEDATEELWTTYFRSIFNPARLKSKAMQAEMPKKYWHNMPETRVIPDLIAGAQARHDTMREAAPTQAPAYARRLKERAMPETQSQQTRPDTLDGLREAASACTRCPLYENATQVVFGEGPANAELMVVGEQPGDQEDLQGRPFVGPAGQLFDELSQKAGFDRTTVYVTNAVKHFKFAPRGKRRIHQKPDAGEVQACKWWLEAERRLLRPRMAIALGATAAEALTGTGKGILKRRSAVEEGIEGLPVFLTVHPSFLLRLPDEAQKTEERERFVKDLAAAMAHLEELRATSRQ